MSLLRVVCEALRQGLQLRTLRLRFMGLSREDARPLLELLRHEIAHRQRCNGDYDNEFSLVEVNLEGNPLVEPEYHAAIMHGLRQLAIFQLGADLTARPGGLAGADLLPPPTRVRPDFPLWRVPSAVPSSRSANASMPPVGLSSGLSSATGAQASGTVQGLSQASRGSSKSLPPQPTESRHADDGQGLERNAVSEGDADSDQEPEIFDHRGRYDMKHQFKEELDALSIRLSQFSPPERRPSAPPAGMRRRRLPDSACQADQTAAGTSASSGGGSSRGANIPVVSTPTVGAPQAYLPDLGLECGFGPIPTVCVSEAAQLDLLDTDSEGSTVSGLQAAAERSGEGSHPRAAGVTPRSEGESGRLDPSVEVGQATAEQQSASAARHPEPESDPHERLDSVTKRLRDGCVPPENALRYTLDRISSDVGSAAVEYGEVPPPPPAKQSQVELEENFTGVDLELLNLPGPDLDVSEGSSSPLEAALPDRPVVMRRRNSA